MGCGQSKIENEEAVARCRDRKNFMKLAVGHRNFFASSHSAYAVSLKNIGAALTDYAHGESYSPSLLPYHSAGVASSSGAPVSVIGAVPGETIRPPPPLPDFPIQRAATMPEMVLPPVVDGKGQPGTIIEERDDGDGVENDEESGSLRQRSRRRKGGSIGGGGVPVNEEVSGKVATRQKEPVVVPVRESGGVVGGGVSGPVADGSPQELYNYIFVTMDNVPRPVLSDDVATHDDTVKSSVVDTDEVGRVKKGKAVESETKILPKEKVSSVSKAAVDVPLVLEKVVEEKAGVRKGKVEMPSKRAKPIGGRSLIQVFMELDDHFLKASESAHEVSKMLEATRLHYHSNFADNTGHIDHSKRVMRVITWNRSFKGLQSGDDQNDDFDSEENETHATVLDKLLAWEKKLYDEVKAGELLKYEYTRKVALLSKQKKRGSNSESSEKLKAAVSHLHTRYIVDMQSMDSTVMEIKRLRDEQLYPKLLQLVDGMAKMWETMRIHHENQYQIVMDLRYLEITQSTKETTEPHHQCTIQLFKVVSEWHKQLGNIVDIQKCYIKALEDWLRLNIIPIESSHKERVSSPPRDENPPIQGLLFAWHERLNLLPDEIVRTAASNFRAVLETIVHHQDEELKTKGRCEDSRRDLDKKSRSLNEWRQKYMEKRTPADEMDPERAEGSRHVAVLADKEMAVEMARKKLEEDEDAYLRQCLQVREKTLTSFKNRLPELFKALSSFAIACSRMYSDLRSFPRSQKSAK
ncbi:hypothetical protein MLD38_030189 [Melastoma candidum]|uniref:Uncharacterized protein n=1 Tax=Melastoma candidum TaxID=119954 RepID=A0ACB9MKJ2_9MYRT|nr:hypothetical protein MLD38_030189 [Melastoma candidum]